jgi:hypothetical protein
MRYLTSALISEGRSDDEFLPRLLTRALDDMCSSDFDDVVEVADVVVMRMRSGPPAVDSVIELVERQAGSFSLVFFHRDQGANPERVKREWIDPLRRTWGSRTERLITVVPVRETEAWLLADGAALRRALGVRWPNDVLGVPGTPRLVEKISDPKAVLSELGDRVRRPIDSYFARLGELVSLDVLADVPAFRSWQEETRDALAASGYKRRT